MATIYLWRAIYEGRDSGEAIAGYGLSQMISYYLVVTIVDALTAVNEDDWQIATDIRDGQISQFLLNTDRLFDLSFESVRGRPNGLSGHCRDSGWPFLFLCNPKHFVGPADATTFILFLISTFFTALLQFFISYSMALLAFWLLEVGTFIFILFAFEYIAGRSSIPAGFASGLAPTNCLVSTPFPYLLFFPVSVYLNRVEGGGALAGPGDSGILGRLRVSHGTMGLEPRHSKILGAVGG